MDSLTYLGIIFLTVISPLPSEVIMPLAGFLAAQGKLNLPLAVLSGVTGSVIGAIPWYLAGRYLGEPGLKRLSKRYPGLIKISPKKLEEAKHWFQRHGGKAVCFCRVLPGIRTLISLPAGLSGMQLIPFVGYTALGASTWLAILASTGYLLGSRYYLVQAYFGPASNVVVGTLVIVAIAWGLRQLLKRSQP